jgi:hypothetical protein
MQFNVGDAGDLAAKAKQMVADLPSYRTMRRNCRRIYEECYTGAQNYEILTGIYAEAIASKQGAHRPYWMAPMQKKSSLHEETL